MATLESIQARIAKLQAEAEAIAKKKSTEIIGKIHKLMADHGVTIADLGGVVLGKGRGKGAKLATAAKPTAAAAKYQDPKTGATWTGHGRAPAWIATAKDRSKFLVDGSAAASVQPAKESTARKGNYVRGPQPMKYRDPASGAEWSGRGKAPSWLASAKDRTKFLIAGAAEGGSDTATTKAAAKKGVAVKSAKAVVGKKAATKKAASKKVAAKKVATKKVSAKKVVAETVSAAKKSIKVKTPAKKPAAIKTASRKEAASKTSPGVLETPVAATEEMTLPAA